MIRLLAFLWDGCWHKWEFTGGQTHIYNEFSNERPAYTRWRYKCEKCGRIKEMRA